MAKTKMPLKTTPKAVETKQATAVASPMPLSMSREKRLPELANFVVPFNLEDEIRKRAYELWEQCGREAGHENEHWLVAEREVRSRHHEQSYSASA